MKKSIIVVCFSLAALAMFAPRLAPQIVSPAWAACEPDEKLDKTTVDTTRQLLTKAGYKNIHDFRRGCDNTWHVKATKDNTEQNVVVLPDGTITTESDN